MKRRNFIVSLSALSAASILNSTGSFATDTAGFRFETPFDGAVVHERSGWPVLGSVPRANGKKGLKIAVTGLVPAGAVGVELVDEASPNTRIPVVVEGTRFRAETVIDQVLTTFKARIITSSGPTGEPIQSRIIILEHSYPRWSFCVDDNIYFLRDIHQKGYKSLFDCFYLRNMRELHRKYKAKMILHLFYATQDEDFSLSMLSDRYKSEWEDNADWLRLGFHANKEFPDHTYLVRTKEQLISDFDQIRSEITRFAGERTYDPLFALHWGSIRKESTKVLADKGVRVLGNGSWQLKKTEYLDRYQVPREASFYLKENDAWYDFKSGMIFPSCELCCNKPRHTPQRCVEILEEAYKKPNIREYLSIMTHEQYFWPFYQNYIPDHWERLDAAFRWAMEHGYRPELPDEDPFANLVDLLRKKTNWKPG